MLDSITTNILAAIWVALSLTDTYQTVRALRRYGMFEWNPVVWIVNKLTGLVGVIVFKLIVTAFFLFVHNKEAYIYLNLIFLVVVLSNWYVGKDIHLLPLKKDKAAVEQFKQELERMNAKG